jgi:hypothetical protein
MTRALPAVAIAALAGCAIDDDPIIVELQTLDATSTRTFEVAGDRELRLVSKTPVLIEAWVQGGAFAHVPDPQLAAGASAAWLAPQLIDGTLATTIEAGGEVELTVWARGTRPPPATRERSLAWLDPAVLDDPTTISFARVMAAISDDAHGGVLLDRWFRAFAAGPGAGRATFARFLDDIAAVQGDDPRGWDLRTLPFRVTGVHNRLDLGRGDDCGELRVSIASTHATLSPLHLIFLFRQPPGDGDITPDGTIHCRGTARTWARLAELDAPGFATAARAVIATGLTRDRFLLAESVELTLSPWQWRQWLPAGGTLVNPPLFQTVDLARVNTPGPTRDAFLADLAANADAIAARRWLVPAAYRATVAEVQPNEKAALVDLGPLPDAATLSRALAMIGCPRCHTDDADFIHTNLEHTPSPFYDRELDARTSRLDQLARDGWPASVPFGPLQPL